MAAAAILAGVALAPDLDLLLPIAHRGASHSIGAAIIVGVVAGALWSSAFVLRSASRDGGLPPSRFRRFAGTSRRDAARWAAAVSLAWWSHILLDWLSNDTRPPLGLMALWPFTDQYYKAGIEIFPPVSRRYWESRFWLYNLKAAAVELLILLPLTAVMISRYRTRARSSAPGDRPPPSGGAGDRGDTSDRPGRRAAR